MIRKLSSDNYRLYSKRKDRNGRRRVLGTFETLAAARSHQEALQLKVERRRMAVRIALGAMTALPPLALGVYFVLDPHWLAETPRGGEVHDLRVFVGLAGLMAVTMAGVVAYTAARGYVYCGRLKRSQDKINRGYSGHGC